MHWISLSVVLACMVAVIGLDMAPTFFEKFHELRPTIQTKVRYVENERRLLSEYALEEVSSGYQKIQDDVSRGWFWPAVHHMGEHSATCSTIRGLLSVVFGRNVIQRFLSPKDTWEYIAAWVASMISIVTFIVVGGNMMFNIVVAKEQGKLKAAKRASRAKIHEIKSSLNPAAASAETTAVWASRTLQSMMDNSKDIASEATETGFPLKKPPAQPGAVAVGAF